MGGIPLLNRRSIWMGTLTLTGAALISRGLGMVYRVLLARFLGAEGLGVYQMIFPLFVTLVTLAVAGTPVAVSQLVADGKHELAPLLRTALNIVLTISVPLACALVLFARPAAELLYHDARFVPLLWVLAPSLIVVAFSSVLRGFFLGQEQMQLPAVSQVSEQIVRVVIMLFLLNWVGDRLLVDAPTVAVALITLGEMISLVVLVWGYTHWERGHPSLTAGKGSLQLTRSLLQLSLPITGTRLLGSLVGVLEAALIPRQFIHSGMTEASAIAFFGQLTGMALPLILFPTALTVSLSTNLVPAIAKTKSQEDDGAVRELIVSSLKTTAYWTMPLSVVLVLFGVNLTDVIFHTRIEPAVFIPLAAGGFFLYFDTAFSGILRGLGRTDVPMRNHLVASATEIALILALGAIPGSGPAAVAWAMTCGFVTSWSLNLDAIIRLTGTRIPWFDLLMRPALAALPLFFAVPRWQHWAGLHAMPQWMAVSGSALLTASLYPLALKLSGAFLRGR